MDNQPDKTPESDQTTSSEPKLDNNHNYQSHDQSFRFTGYKVFGIVFAGLLVIVIILFLNSTKLFDSSKVEPVATTKNTKTTSSSEVQKNSGSTNQLDWILQYHFLSLVESNQTALKELNNSKIYVILSHKELASSSPLANPDHLNLIPTDYINNYQKFATQYSSGQIKYPIQAVLFDDSSDTPSSVVPTNEAQNPLEYDQQLSSFSTKNHLISMCDYILAKRTAQKKPLASPCQITVMNYPQQSERNSSDYFKVVNEAVQVIKQQQPNQPIFAGLSTNPRGTAITASQLVDAIQATDKIVSGYWISIPTSGGVGCPNCSTQNPNLLPEFLADLAQNKS